MEETEYRERRAKVDRAVRDETVGLTEQQRRVLALRYGLSHTLAETGEWLGISRDEARILERQAHETLGIAY